LILYISSISFDDNDMFLI